jgi:hypothetical protein
MNEFNPELWKQQMNKYQIIDIALDMLVEKIKLKEITTIEAENLIQEAITSKSWITGKITKISNIKPQIICGIYFYNGVEISKSMSKLKT